MRMDLARTDPVLISATLCVTKPPCSAKGICSSDSTAVSVSRPFRSSGAYRASSSSGKAMGARGPLGRSSSPCNDEAIDRCAARNRSPDREAFAPYSRPMSTFGARTSRLRAARSRAASESPTLRSSSIWCSPLRSRSCRMAC